MTPSAKLQSPLFKKSRNLEILSGVKFGCHLKASKQKNIILNTASFDLKGVKYRSFVSPDEVSKGYFAS